MKYRKLDENGDYSFGQNSQEFLTDVEAVAQAIKTRMQLWQGTFWRSLSDGYPMTQEVLGQSGSINHINILNAKTRNRIIGTKGVNRVLNIDGYFDGLTRKYTYKALVQTQYSITEVSGQI